MNLFKDFLIIVLLPLIVVMLLVITGCVSINYKDAERDVSYKRYWGDQSFKKFSMEMPNGVKMKFDSQIGTDHSAELIKRIPIP